LRSFVVAIPLILCMAGATDAQQMHRAAALPAQPADVRVNVSMNFFVPAPAGDAQAAVKAQEDARRVLYESASRECAVLRASVAGDCRLESISVNMSRGYNHQQPDGFNANGNFSYRITLK
jgi:hypothetical protein